MKVEIDTHGILANRSFHDGRISGIVLRGQSEVELHLSDVHERQFVLTLRGVSSLNVDNFRLGNIISTICCLDWNKAPPFIKAEALRDRSDPGDNSGYMVICLDPSYGCKLSAIFTELQLGRL